MTANPDVTFGALPPPGAPHKIGDRADKLCVEAATEVLAQRMVCLVLFKDVDTGDECLTRLKLPAPAFKGLGAV